MKITIPLGTLVLGELVGSGGYGEVYKARVNDAGPVVAVKILNPSSFHSNLDAVRARFSKEAEILMTLRHPHIIGVFGFGEAEVGPYIVMEYFEGFDLQKARDKVGAPKPLAVLPFLELCASALGFAHQRGVVHRDVKPSNLLTVRGDARVIDFGIAQILDPTGERLTRTGGTPVGDAFSAPELMDNPRLVDPRCDIYSLGASWFWLLTGSTPRGRNWESAIRGVDEMTKPYEMVLLKTLEQPDKRYQTMEELVSDVRALTSGSTPAASSDDALDDDSALVLGAVFEQFAPEGEPASAYRLEQELAGKLSRFALGLALRNLGQLELIRPATIDGGWNSEPALGIATSEAGEQWVKTHRIRVELLLSQWRSRGSKSFEVGDDDPLF